MRFLKSISIRVLELAGARLLRVCSCPCPCSRAHMRYNVNSRSACRGSLFGLFDSIYRKLLLKLSIADTLEKRAKQKKEAEGGGGSEEEAHRRWNRRHTYIHTYRWQQRTVVIAFFRQRLHRTYVASLFLAFLSSFFFCSSEDQRVTKARTNNKNSTKTAPVFQDALSSFFSSSFSSFSFSFFLQPPLVSGKGSSSESLSSFRVFFFSSILPGVLRRSRGQYMYHRCRC